MAPEGRERRPERSVAVLDMASSSHPGMALLISPGVEIRH